ITFQDGAGTIQCGSPVAGTYSPVQTLAPFNGKPSNGTWTLTVRDHWLSDTGNLISWSLNFGCTLDSPEHSVADFAIYPIPNNGNFTISYPSVSAGDINVMVH